MFANNFRRFLVSLFSHLKITNQKNGNLEEEYILIFGYLAQRSAHETDGKTETLSFNANIFYSLSYRKSLYIFVNTDSN